MVRDSIRRKTLLAATAVALTMSGAAWAENAQDTGKTGPAIQATPVKAGNPDAAPAPSVQGEVPKSPSSDSSAVAEKSPPAAAAGDVIAAQADDQALVSDVVGAKVVGPDGADLGKVADLIVGRDGKVAGTVLSVGGFLGIGDKQIAVPWSALQQGGPDQPLTIAMTKDQLEAAPEFKTLADQRAEQQAALTPPPAAVPAPATGTQ